ncbi:MAG: HPr kinase/phosphatase C-terminal domain-containing protein [Alphaproteobacteria bacterium]|nr:HPr kinase/phosphatase C-terminal domain-containing protein [Alphaproteobacteria bacterium]
MLVHASCVKWQNKGILLIGDSGCGKSTGALALIGKGATLIADDYVEISVQNDTVVADCPQTISGKMEVRGVGIISIENLPQTNIDVVINCVPDFKSYPRMSHSKSWEEAGKKVPLYELCPFENIFTEKVSLILATL